MMHFEWMPEWDRWAENWDGWDERQLLWRGCLPTTGNAPWIGESQQKLQNPSVSSSKSRAEKAPLCRDWRDRWRTSTELGARLEGTTGFHLQSDWRTVRLWNHCIYFFLSVEGRSFLRNCLPCSFGSQGNLSIKTLLSESYFAHCGEFWPSRYFGVWLSEALDNMGNGKKVWKWYSKISRESKLTTIDSALSSHRTTSFKLPYVVCF